MPLAADDPSLTRVLAEAKEASQERRKRELGVFLCKLSRQRPVGERLLAHAADHDVDALQHV